MLAQKNPYIKEAVRTVYRLTQKKKIRQLFDAREDQIRCEIDQQIIQERTRQELDQTKTKLDLTETKLNQTEAKLEQTEAKVERLENLLKKHGINADE